MFGRSELRTFLDVAPRRLNDVENGLGNLQHRMGSMEHRVMDMQQKQNDFETIDSDDFLIHLQRILTDIHKTFYELGIGRSGILESTFKNGKHYGWG